MVGMEGSAVLAVRKVVVVARGALAERAGAGSARVVCVDGGRVCCGRAGCDRDLRRHPANVLRASFCSKKTQMETQCELAIHM
jgi:hypothetical protein